MFPPDQTAELELPPENRPAAERTDPILVDPHPHRPGDTAVIRPMSEAWHPGAFIADRYLIERRLGGGAMGEVYLARDRLLRKHVALKVLKPELAKNRTTVRRFLREVALAHSVTHPNVVRIHDTGEAHGLPYFSMEYLQGQTLDELIHLADPDNPPMSIREIRDVCVEILDGLEAAHRAGVVHRDLKPANVMLTHRGAIVMDFGVAGFEKLPVEVKPNPSDAVSLVRTEAGTIFGSPAYMAPELWDGAPATVQSDLYGLGVMLYHMLTGRLPYDAPSAREFLEKLKAGPPTPIRSLRRNIPWNLSLLVDRCMAHDQDRRPTSAKAAAGLVAPFRRRVAALSIAAIMIVGLGAIAWGAGPDRELSATGLPDGIAGLDLASAVRSWDVADYESATRQFERLAIRAPDSAAVAFWRATLAAELDDLATLRTICDGRPLEGESPWIELAEAACSGPDQIASPMLNLLSGRSSALQAGFLALAAEQSLVPRLESARAPGPELRASAKDALERLGTPGLASVDPLDPPTLVRTGLARMDIHIALGQIDAARESLETTLEAHPDAANVLARAAWFYTQIGERDRATSFAEEVSDRDPRPVIRGLLDHGKLQEAAGWIDTLERSPLHSRLTELYCAYAFRFEVEQLPERCTDLQPGLTRVLWRGRIEPSDEAAMSSIERTIAARQRELDFGTCAAPSEGEVPIVLTLVPAPFSAYLRQLDISSTLCPHAPKNANRQLARRLADQLMATDPQDPWSALVHAQVDEVLGAASMARGKRELVAARWAESDESLPLVRRLRASLVDGDER